LARTMYNRLFLWLVDLCNRTLIDATMKKVNFIGILDIAGLKILIFNDSLFACCFRLRDL
jgi:myosin heavy subunit